jgi:spore coat protein A, manganese oxidase
MRSKNRRAFLKLFAQSLPALALPQCLGATKSVSSGRQVLRTPSSVDRYIDPLPIPKKLQPYDIHKGKALFRVRMVEFKQKLHSQLPPTKLWGYEGQYPGPIFETYKHKPIEVQWENHLPDSHIFVIDSHIHGAMPPAPAVRTVPHLHGSRSSSESDGLPEKWFVPGQTAHYSYPNGQQAATLWYHDHAVGITRLNVYAGLSGFYLLRDDEERSMGLPSDEYEIPLLLQDRSLDDDGQLVYSPTHEDGVKLPPGVWGPEFFGDIPVVNGAIFPYLNVEPRPYRLRVLNGMNSRFLNLYFNLAKHPTDIPALVPFHQIGTDGGFLPKPAPLTRLLMGPAERADLIIDFTGLDGKTVTLSNNGSAPYPGWDMMVMHHAQLYEWMQFRVTLPRAGDAKPASAVQTIGFSKLDESASVATRDFVLSERLDAQGRSLGVRINEKGYDDPVTEIVKLDSVEKWRFINTTDDAHPMHLHLVQFQILHRQGFDIAALQNGTLRFLGSPRPPAANEAGWKDTAIVNPRDVLTIIVRFEGFTGRYVFHCHMLEHEDNDMMRPYEVVS